MREKVIVIGAGMGGLSAAIRLQLAGYNVEIYEKNQTPGGKMSQIKAEGYTFDVGPTIVMMPDLYCSLFELAGKNPEDYFIADSALAWELDKAGFSAKYLDDDAHYYKRNTKLLKWLKKNGIEG